MPEITRSKLLIYTSYLTPDKNALISEPTVIADSSHNFERFDIPFVITYGADMG